MKYILLSLAYYLFITDQAHEKKPSEMSDIEAMNLKGPVKSIVRTYANTATLVDNKWVITDTNKIYHIEQFNREGFMYRSVDMLKSYTLRTRYSWQEGKSDKTLLVENGKDDERELTVYTFINDSTQIHKTFSVNEDTLINKILDETIVVYTANQCSTTYYEIKGKSKMQMMRSIDIQHSPDTSYTYKISGDTAVFTSFVLERDMQLNPTKTVSYTNEDTVMNISKYEYYD